MAIYHFSASIISRGKGHSVVAAAAYRAGERIVEARTGDVHDYRRRSGVDHCEIMAPRGAPGWCKKRAQLWNRAEDAERRIDGQVGRQVELALPRELSLKQRRRLVRGYVRKNFTRRGMVADIAYHDQDGKNPHVHMLLTMRLLAGEAFSSKKQRDWNKRDCLGAWRNNWERHVNGFLRRAGCPNRVDHRTLTEQRADAIEAGDEDLATQLDRAPGQHFGSAATAIQARANKGVAAAAAHDDAIRIGEVDQPDYRCNIELTAPSWRGAVIQDEVERENAERVEIRQGLGELARQRVLLEQERQQAIMDGARAVGLDDETINGALQEAEAKESGSGWGAIESATTRRQMEITNASRTTGLDNEEIERLYARAETQEPGSGWRSVEAAAMRVERWQRAKESARHIGVDIDGVEAGARASADPLAEVESEIERRLEEIKVEARFAGLDDDEIDEIYHGAEAQQSGSGWAAVESATIARVDRRKRAEQAALNVGIDIDTVSADTRTSKEDALTALESATARRQTEIKASARVADLDDATINKVYRDAELREKGSGWMAIVSAMETRAVRRKMEASARAVGLDVDAVLVGARARSVDPLKALGSATKQRQAEIVVSARAADLDAATINKVHRDAESVEKGSGWMAIVSATETRAVRRKMEASARAVGLDVDAVLVGARARSVDPLKALGSATKQRQAEIAASARAADLDAATINKVHRDAELREKGSGWMAIVSATETRAVRRKMEASARAVGLDVDAVLVGARARSVDPLKALGSATKQRQAEIVASARAADLDAATINKVHRDAELREKGSGWMAIVAATETRVVRRKMEASARAVGLDVDAVLVGARARSVDPLKALGSATKQRQAEIVASARAADLDAATINKVHRDAESVEKGSGWMAIVSATETRAVRRKMEASARAVGLDVDAVVGDARAARVDPLTALESATKQVQGEIREAARAANLDDATINNVYRAAESVEKGSGWRAIESATKTRLVEREEEASARAVGLDVGAVVGNARAANVDPLTALESATKQWQEELKASARAAGLDDDAIGRIYGDAERRSLGSGWVAIEEATVDESRFQEVIEKTREELGFAVPASMLRAAGRGLREEYRESSGAGRLVARLAEIPDACYAMSPDEEEEHIVAEQLHHDNVAKQEQHYQEAVERYKKELADYEKKSFWERRRWSAPGEPQRSPASARPSEDEITQYRLKLIARIVQFVRAVIERLLDWRERDKPPPPAPEHPDSLRTPRQQTQQERGTRWSR